MTLSLKGAKSSLIGAGLEVGSVETDSNSTIEKGIVISQFPGDSTVVAPGSAVDLVLSAGFLVVVPDLVGLPRIDAEALIIGARLTVGLITVATSASVAKDSVISQVPEADPFVPIGSPVALVLSSGPPNQAPDLDAGANITLTFPARANLVGVVKDDGLPAGTLEIAWTKIDGPGRVIFGPFSAEATIADFSMPGIYVLEVTAFDGELTTTDEVTVLVNPEADPAD